MSCIDFQYFQSSFSRYCFHMKDENIETTALKHHPFCINLKDSIHLYTLQVFEPYSGHVIREFELHFREHTNGSNIFTSLPRSHHPERHVNHLLASSVTHVVWKHEARSTRHCWASDSILLDIDVFLVRSLLINLLPILSEFGS